MGESQQEPIILPFGTAPVSIFRDKASLAALPFVKQRLNF